MCGSGNSMGGQAFLSLYPQGPALQVSCQLARTQPRMRRGRCGGEKLIRSPHMPENILAPRSQAAYFLLGGSSHN